MKGERTRIAELTTNKQSYATPNVYADDGIDLHNAGQFLGIVHGIDDAGMTAPGQYHKSFVSYMQQIDLIIENERVPFPLAAS